MAGTAVMAATTFKLTVVLPDHVYGALRDMKEENSVSMTEQVRRCIATEKWLTDLRKGGTKVLLEDRDGRVREVIFK